jgi:carbonic anhydrase/acetyltransferase-like protein (isoleucine patch superfamily)
MTIRLRALSDEEKETLGRMARSRTLDAGRVRRARIGVGCLVGANALVTEGKEFPEHSLIVGAPAKVARALDAATVAQLRASALRYVANWRRFAAGLRPIG